MKKPVSTIAAFFLFFQSLYGATLVNDGSINWNGNWQTVSKNDTFHASTNLLPDSAQTVYSGTWNGNASNTDVGVVVLIYGSDNTATGTLTITLEQDLNDDGNWADATDRGNTTFVFSVPSINQTTYYYFKLGTPHTENAGTDNYRYSFANSGNTANEIGLRVNSAATSTVGIKQVLSATANVAAADVTYINGTCTACTNTPTSSTVTYNVNLNGTSYGDINIGNQGTLWFSTAATTQTYLEVAGNVDINVGGSFYVGSPTFPIPASSTATFESEATAADRYIYVKSGGKFKMQGAPFVGGVWRTKTTDATASVGDRTVSVSHNVLAAGWVSGDDITISATGAAGQTEEVIISTLTANTITITTDWAYTHLSGAEICNLSRTVNITTSGTNDLQVFNYSTIDGDMDIDYVRAYDYRCNAGLFYNYTSVNTTYDIDYSVFDSPIIGTSILFYNSSKFVNYNFSNNCFYNFIGYAYNFSTQAQTTTQYGSMNVTISSNSFIKQKDSSLGQIQSAAGSGTLTVLDSNFYDYVAGGAYNRALAGTTNNYIEFRRCNFWALEEIIATDSNHELVFNNCVLGGDGTNTIASAYADIKIYNLALILLYNTKLLSTNEVVPSVGAFEDFYKFRVASHNHDATQYRYKVWEVYGTMTDNTTTSMTDQSGSGRCLVMNPTSSTEGQNLRWVFYIPVTAATDPQLKFYVKASAGTPVLFIDVFDSDDDLTLLVNNASVALTTSWAQYSASAISPTDTGYCRIALKAMDDGSSRNIGIDTLSYVLDGVTYTVDFERWKDGMPDMAAEGAGSGGGGGATMIITNE